jgi:hypothetical protein
MSSEIAMKRVDLVHMFIGESIHLECNENKGHIILDDILSLSQGHQSPSSLF